MILVGDVMDQLATLPEESVQCVVTSPPYFGLRDYGTASWEGGDDPNCNHRPDEAGSTKKPTAGQREHAGRFCGPVCWKCGARRIDSQIGLEPTLDAYVAKMVEVFRAVRRVLRKDGTVFCNLGDAYANAGGRGEQGTTGQRADRTFTYTREASTVPPAGFKPKDLLGVPWRVAFALQADGWWLRQDIVWHKPNPMPESVTDRCTKAHEYVFLLTKAERYYFDAEAIKEKGSDNTNLRISKAEVERIRNGRAAGANTSLGMGPTPKAVQPDGMTKQNASFENACCLPVERRNRRSVWTIPTEAYPHAHFATYPRKLVEPCILAGTSAKGCCATCGMPWVRVVEREQLKRDRPNDYVKRTGEDGTGNACSNSVAGVSVRTLGWRPQCECKGTLQPVPCTVLDPFLGSGTTAAVCVQHGRRWIGIELNPEYAKLAEKRIAAAEREYGCPLFQTETA